VGSGGRTWKIGTTAGLAKRSWSWTCGVHWGFIKGMELQRRRAVVDLLRSSSHSRDQFQEEP
jgi:hypothetical protein